MKKVISCPICNNSSFKTFDVLPNELISDWKLSTQEVDYINLQQGFHCTSCNCNLRVMTLASHMLEHYNCNEIFIDFIKSFEGNILEINQVGSLSSFLKRSDNHILKSYPEIDIENISYEDKTFDVILHSDTLEHIPNSIRGLSECYRILKKGGVMFFTIPIIHDRMTIKRHGMPKAYHSSYDYKADDYLVYTEYGADFYKELFMSGFSNISLFTITDYFTISIKAIK